MANKLEMAWRENVLSEFDVGPLVQHVVTGSERTAMKVTLVIRVRALLNVQQERQPFEGDLPK